MVEHCCATVCSMLTMSSAGVAAAARRPRMDGRAGGHGLNPCPPLQGAARVTDGKPFETTLRQTCSSPKA